MTINATQLDPTYHQWGHRLLCQSQPVQPSCPTASHTPARWWDKEVCCKTMLTKIDGNQYNLTQLDPTYHQWGHRSPHRRQSQPVTLPCPTAPHTPARWWDKEVCCKTIQTKIDGNQYNLTQLDPTYHQWGHRSPHRRQSQPVTLPCPTAPHTPARWWDKEVCCKTMLTKIDGNQYNLTQLDPTYHQWGHRSPHRRQSQPVTLPCPTAPHTPARWWDKEVCCKTIQTKIDGNQYNLTQLDPTYHQWGHRSPHRRQSQPVTLPCPTAPHTPARWCDHEVCLL